jgi:hypothetical protein
MFSCPFVFLGTPGWTVKWRYLGGLRPMITTNKNRRYLAGNLNLVAVRETNQCTPSKFAGALVPDSRVGRLEHSLL